jgi:hypothetical protein
MVMCKKIIVGGAYAAISENGKLPMVVSPCEPVVMASFVVILAVTRILMTSIKPKKFHAYVSGRAYDFLVVIAFATTKLKIAVIISPMPAT